jgi:hypothetical protein
MLTFSYRNCPVVVLGLGAIVIVALLGCSDKGLKKVTVKGTIAYKDQALSSGLLQLVGAEGAYSAASIQADGTFIITDVVPGEVKVGVMEKPQSQSSSSGEKTVPKTAPVALPEKFRDPQMSGVTYTITPETKELHIDLK